MGLIMMLLLTRLDETREGEGAHDSEAEGEGKRGRLVGNPGKVAPEHCPNENDVDASEAADPLRGPVVLYRSRKGKRKSIQRLVILCFELQDREAQGQ